MRQAAAGDVMNILFILNDAPSAQRSLSALRLACALSTRSSIYVRVFLIGAAAACARTHQGPEAEPDGTESMVHTVILRGGDVRVCGTSGGVQEAGPAGGLVEGAVPSSLEELSRWIPEADRVLVF
ncbi:MAG TPA: DsrE family protein [Steroidobacteraceae bacterium]|nr:DsrE family protein [Steroidobacteraceae bacterium]